MAEPTPAERVLVARAALGAALDAIDEKLNVPKRVKASYRRNPAPWIAGLVGAGLVIAGGIAWAIVRRR